MSPLAADFVTPAARAAPSASGGRMRRMSVRMLLTALVLATAVPMAGLLVWHVARVTTEQLDAADTLVRRVAEDGAAVIHLAMQSQLRVAANVAQRPRVRALDATACDSVLGEIPLIDDTIVDMSTLDLEGRVVCGRRGQSAAASAQWLAPLRTVGRQVFDPPRVDAGTGVWTFAFAVPLRADDGRVQGALRITLPLSLLVALIDEPLPEGGVFTLMDDEGRIIARSPGWSGFIGERVAAAAAVQQRARERVTFRAQGVDGTERLYASRRVGSLGWITSVGVPVENIYAPARHAFLVSGLAALAVLVACAWLVVPLSRRIVEPLRALEDTARLAGEGDFSRRAPVGGPAELVSVAAGFNRMLDQLPQLQRVLRESELRHRTLIENLSNNAPGVFFEMRIDADGRLSMPFVAERAHELFDLSAQRLMRSPRAWFTRIHPHDRARVTEALARSRRDVARVAVEFRVLHARGMRHCLVQSQPERDGDGMVWFGCAVDVTTLKDAQRALQIQSETLEQRVQERTTELAAANEALEAFSYSVAHDLRAPLHSIDGFSHALARALKDGDPARAEGFNTRVTNCARRMGELIDGLLALARAGREAIGSDRMRTLGTVREICAELDPHRSVEWTIAPLPQVAGNEALLRQVWFNLLSNAVKYTSRTRRPAVTVACELTGQEVVFEVRDNGAGFDEQYADRLFSPFQRLHHAGEFEGNGVGLAVTRRIVERHGGRIWAEAKVNAGAVFRFTLPRERVVAEG